MDNIVDVVNKLSAEANKNAREAGYYKGFVIGIIASWFDKTSDKERVKGFEQMLRRFHNAPEWSVIASEQRWLEMAYVEYFRGKPSVDDKE